MIKLHLLNNKGSREKVIIIVKGIFNHCYIKFIMGGL